MDARCPACATRWRGEGLSGTSLRSLDCPRCGGPLAEAPLVFGMSHRFHSSRTSRHASGEGHGGRPRLNGAALSEMSSFASSRETSAAVLSPPAVSAHVTGEPRSAIETTTPVDDGAGSRTVESSSPPAAAGAEATGRTSSAPGAAREIGQATDAGLTEAETISWYVDDDPADAALAGPQTPERLDADEDPSGTVLIPSPFPPASPLGDAGGNEESANPLRVEKRVRLGIDGAGEEPESELPQEAADFDLPLSTPKQSPFLLRGGIAGAVIGLLSGFAYLLVFAGVDWTSAPLLGLLWSLPPGALDWIGGLLVAGIAVGVTISWLTRSGAEPHRR